MCRAPFLIIAGGIGMKTDIGNGITLYPLPVVVLGAMVDGKPNWMEAAHVGIIAQSRILVSCAKAHYTSKGARKGMPVSVSLVDAASLPKADYVGAVSGNDTDKSEVYSWQEAGNGAPVPDDVPLTMACTVDDVYETPGFDNLVLRVDSTLAEESILTDGRIDYSKFKPVLFEGPDYSYMSVGEVIGKGGSFKG